MSHEPWSKLYVRIIQGPYERATRCCIIVLAMAHMLTQLASKTVLYFAWASEPEYSKREFVDLHKV